MGSALDPALDPAAALPASVTPSISSPSDQGLTRTAEIATGRPSSALKRVCACDWISPGSKAQAAAHSTTQASAAQATNFSSFKPKCLAVMA